MTTTIDAVCFDFAGTLFSDRDLRDVHLQQLRFVAEAIDVEASDQELRAAYRHGIGRSVRAIGPRPSYLHRELFGGAFAGMAEVLGGKLADATVQEAVDRQYRATIDHAVLRPDAVPTLEALRELGCHLQIVSNIDEEQLAPMVERFGLDSLVDVAISSEAAGSCKPDRRIFELALANAGSAPEQTLFVGDSPAHDVAGPAALGIRTAWLDVDGKADPGPVHPDHTIHTLSEVPALIQQSRAEYTPSGGVQPARDRGGGTVNVDALERYIGERLGSREPITVTPMVGGGSCEVFAVDRGGARWVLRRAPRHASSATAHDVLREFRILDAIKDEPVRIARPVLACDDPEVFGAPFYVMERVDGVPIRSSIPDAWASVPDTQGGALEELVDALIAIHAVDWQARGLGDMAHIERYLERQSARWLSQLESYGGRDLPAAHDVAEWLDAHRPPDQAPTLYHGDYKLDNVLFATDAPPRLLAVVDWEMASIGDPLVDLAWALIFHPAEGTMRLGTAKEPRFAPEAMPTIGQLVERYAAGSGRDTSNIAWYAVFARWKLAIVLEGSYAKFVRGLSDKPVHEFFGQQADLLLASASSMIERGDT